MSFSSKKENSKTQKEKEKDSLQSAGDTFFDSLHNSKISEDIKNNIIISYKKENNFYLALKCMQGPNSDTLLLGTSEFSESNPNQTKDYNISRYLHHPIVKEINKEGNKLIRIKPMQNYVSIVNHPYIAKYNNMKNIFKDILMSMKENQTNEIINKSNTNKVEILHKKNNSSIPNTINNNNKNKNHIISKKNNNNFTYKNNEKTNTISNKINSTTVTKENNKKNNFGDIQDIKKQINYDDNLEDLEEPKDINIKDYLINEEDKKNKNIMQNNDSDCRIYSFSSQNNIIEIQDSGEKEDMKRIKNNSISTKKDEILVIDSFNENNQNYNNNNKGNENKTTTVKKLRKKYERAEFKKYIYNTNPHINRYIFASQDLKKEINAEIRKKTEDLGMQKSKKKINKQYADFNYLTKYNIKINSSKKFSDLEDSLSQLSNNINKNLLDNFNNCGNIKANEFLMRYHNDMNNNNNDNQNNYINYFIESSEKSKSHNSPPPAELLDFISNKSDTNANNNIKFNNSASNNKENNYFNKKNISNNNTFVIKNIDNKREIFSEIGENNLYYELNRSAKSEYLVNRMRNNPLNQSQVLVNDISDQYLRINYENEDNDFYDFVTPERNPEAIIRRNFTLISSIYQTNSKLNLFSYYNENNNKFNSCSIKIAKTKLIKDFSIISEKNKYSFISKNNSSRRNIFYLKENKRKIRDSIEHPQPETVYDLSFYKNLIENGSKIKRINYKNILKNHKKIKLEDRVHAMVWMMQICEEFAFKRDTFHYACNYFDNYLTFGKEKIKNKKILELIGITCISISGKVEEVQIPKLKEYANSIDESFEIKDIIDMEKKLCLTLGWKLINVNINTWLNWYTCQWDLYIDSVDNIKSELLKFIKEEEIIYYKKSNDNSYYNYRKICQLIDIIVLDYFSYNFESRILMAVSLLVIICINYKLDYNFKKKNFKQKTPFSKYIFTVYTQFINQSFDYNFNDENIQKALGYCYKFKNFNFTFELPLLYQIHQDLLENGNYEDFISYQTTNENLESYLKEIIIRRNKKSSSEKTTNNTDTSNKYKFSSNKKTNI